MKHAMQWNPLVGSALVALCLALLAGCGQPADDAATVAAPPAAESASSSGSAGNGEVTSIDADGNVAPFGFASRQPVEVPPIAAAVPVAATTANSGQYGVHCIACHGANAQGVEGLGLSLVDSTLVKNSSPGELKAFLQAGRMPGSPDSVTGVPMPAFAWMDDAQLDEIVSYVQSL
jgi:mono/diheme cytochrome c family protein